MTIFRTPLNYRVHSDFQTSQSFLSLGSCFADNIGNRLLENKWQGLVNPFGTLFHPFAIFQLLKNRPLSEELFLTYQDSAHHFRLPKTYFAEDKPRLVEKWRSDLRALQSLVTRPRTVILLTLGTAFLYEHAKGWVANCHQQPSGLFQKRLTSVEDMLKDFIEAFEQLPRDCHFVISVSPVRHPKEGLIESSLSKSSLRLLAESMVALCPERIRYFPAYEIMMDELRDYRFYERDMIHPSAEAIDFIWDQFQKSHMDKSAIDQIARWQSLLARINHRPLHPQSREHQDFLAKLEKDLQPFLPLGIERELSEVQSRRIKFD